MGVRGLVLVSVRCRQLIAFISTQAMIADRVVLLPGTRVGTRAIMGSGALGKRNGTYGAGSTWIGNSSFFLPLAMRCLSHLSSFLLRQRRGDLSQHGIEKTSHRMRHYLPFRQSILQERSVVLRFSLHNDPSHQCDHDGIFCDVLVHKRCWICTNHEASPNPPA